MVVHIIVIRLSKGTETTITSLFSNMMIILTTHLVHIQNICILNLVGVAIKIKCTCQSVFSLGNVQENLCS